MDRKKIFADLIEVLINETEKENFEDMYGVGSQFKVTNVGLTSRGNTLYIEGKIILGKSFDESYLDTEFINLLIFENIKLIYNGTNVNLSISFDA